MKSTIQYAQRTDTREVKVKFKSMTVQSNKIFAQMWKYHGK